MMRIEMYNGSSWVECTDTISASLVQSANSIGSLTLKLAPSSPCVQFATMNTRVRVYDNQAKRYEFYGRVISREPNMDSSGKVTLSLVCEDCIAFLKDTTVQLDSTKAWFEGTSSTYMVNIDEDGTRTISTSDLVKIILKQHNSTIGDNAGDAWKKVVLGNISLDDSTTVSAEYEANTYDMLCDIADDSGAEFRATYDGTSITVDFNDSGLGSNAGTFAVGDNIAKSAVEQNMSDVVTRMFPFGETYAKLKKTECSATEVDGSLKGSKWDKKSGKKMCRFDVSGAIKVELVVGYRHEDYAMVFFTDGGVTGSNVEIMKKYTTGKTTGTNITKHYPVPDGAKYCYVMGGKSSGSKCTKYAYYKNVYDEEVKKDYRVGLGFWNGFITDAQRSKQLDKYGLTLGYTLDNSNDKLYYLQKNTDKYGVIEGTCVKDNLLKTDKITNSKKAVYSLNDLVSGSTKKSKNAKTRAYRFFKWACRQAKNAAVHSTSITVDAYDLAAAGLNYSSLKLYDNWRVTNSLIGLDATVEVVRVKRDVLKPWEVSVDLGAKAVRASGAGGSGSGSRLEAGTRASGDGDEGDDAADSAATAAAAISSAEEASEKANKAGELADKVVSDVLAAGNLAKHAYDNVYPITSAMRELIDESKNLAAEATAQVDRSEYIYENQNDLASCRAEYSQMNSRSAVKWQSVYTASINAWASEDEETQAKIQEAYEDLYGVGGTADNPKPDSAQGHLNTAVANQIEAESTLLSAKADLAASQSKKTELQSQLESSKDKYDEAKETYDALKKKNSATKAELDAAWETVKKVSDDIERVEAAIAQADTDIATNQAKVANSGTQLEACKQAVATAEAEVDLAMNGIHSVYKSCIEQSAEKIALSVTETDVDGKISTASQTITSSAINQAVSQVDAKGYITSSEMTQTVNGWSWVTNAKGLQSYMSFSGSGGTGTLSLGGSATAINMGGSSSTINMCGVSSISYGSRSFVRNSRQYTAYCLDIDGPSVYGNDGDCGYVSAGDSVVSNDVVIGARRGSADAAIVVRAFSDGTSEVSIDGYGIVTGYASGTTGYLFTN